MQLHIRGGMVGLIIGWCSLVGINCTSTSSKCIFGFSFGDGVFDTVGEAFFLKGENDEEGGGGPSADRCF